MSDDTTPLPIDELEADFDAALAAGHVTVSAATGSGKSTRLPAWARRHGRVLVVEPRRVAAVSLARWLAGADTEPAAGGAIGYAVRGDARCDRTTGVIFATPGMALQWLVHERLDGFTTVILDEFHERRWDTDLLLALLQAAGQHHLVVTSATIDGERLAEHIGARHLSSAGRAWPVEVRHQAREPRAMPTARGLAERVAEAVGKATERSDGDILVFLPGKGEIAAARRALKTQHGECIELHAGADLRTQRRALAPGEQRRVILATNVAESALTVPGVTAVIDSGLERRTLRRNGRSVLALQAIAADSAEQRRGRAGRLQPGLCIRLWGQNAPLATTTPPEVQREELTELVLAAACAGRVARELAFPDPLPDEALQRAESALQAMGAVATPDCATARGRQLFTLPVDADVAHLVLSQPDQETGGFMADLAGALSVRRPPVFAADDPNTRQDLIKALGRACDATLLVAGMRGCAPEEATIRQNERREARQLAAQIRELADLPARPAALPEHAVIDRAIEAAATAAPALAFVRRERRRHAMGNGGEEVEIADDSLLADDAEVALVLTGHSVPGKGTRQTRTIANCLAPLDSAVLVRAGLASAEISAPECRDGRIVTRREWTFAGRLVASETTEPEGAEAREAIARLILSGDLLAPAGNQIQDDIAAWSLYVALGYADGEVPEPHAWLVERLARTGVEHGADIELVEPDDLRFDGVPAWERERFDRTYPREVQLSGLRMQIHYDVRRKTVTAEKIEGSRKSDPKRWELPAWSGWHVQFQRASRVVDVK